MSDTAGSSATHRVYVNGITAADVLLSDQDGAIVRELDDGSETWFPWSDLPSTPKPGRHRAPDAPLTLSIRQQRQVRLGRQLGLSEREIARDLAPQMDGVTVDQIVRAIR